MQCEYLISNRSDKSRARGGIRYPSLIPVVGDDIALIGILSLRRRANTLHWLYPCSSIQSHGIKEKERKGTGIDRTAAIHPFVLPGPAAHKDEEGEFELGHGFLPSFFATNSLTISF